MAWSVAPNNHRRICAAGMYQICPDDTLQAFRSRGKQFRVSATATFGVVANPDVKRGRARGDGPRDRSRVQCSCSWLVRASTPNRGRQKSKRSPKDRRLPYAISLVPSSLYRLQNDFVSAAAQGGVEPEPRFLPSDTHPPQWVGCERRASDVLYHACSEALFLSCGAPPAPGASFPSPLRGTCARSEKRGFRL
jgi:hypothetical protein